MTYHGAPAPGDLLAQYLRDEGCRVQVPPLRERRDLPGAAEEVAVQLIVAGTLATIKAAIAKFKARRPNSKIEIDDEDSTGYL